MDNKSSSSVAVADAPETANGAHAAAVRPHPGQAQYVAVAVILAAVTGAEVAIYYVVTGKPLVAILVGLASIKFGLVAAYFMHLKFDARLLRRVFLTGIILACGVYAVGLFTMDVLFH